MKDVISTDTLQTDDVTSSYPISDSLERLQETTITNYESIWIDAKGITISYTLQTGGGMQEMNIVTAKQVIRLTRYSGAWCIRFVC